MAVATSSIGPGSGVSNTQFNDKGKPMEVRMSNMNAAKGEQVLA
jgi:T-complex protein 1 subunit delta